MKNAPTYTELISSGNIDIISDNSIKDAIIKYYQELERIELVLDLNDSRLKQITKKQLQDPENELKMINGVNFRNFLTLVHYNICVDQKEKARGFLTMLESKYK